MVYMTRLGLWGNGTPFEDFTSFKKAAEASGSIAVLMLVALELKVRCTALLRTRMRWQLQAWLLRRTAKLCS